MGFFDRFRSKDETTELDPLADFVLDKLEMGYLVDYDLKTWTVTDHNSYTYNDGRTAREWELTASRDKRYLEHAQDEEESWSFSRSIPLGAISSDSALSIRDHILENEDPPDRILYKDKAYFMEGSVGGEQVAGKGGASQELILWEFMDEEEENFISIVQWSETEFTAVCGIFVEDYEFSNILPGETT